MHFPHDSELARTVAFDPRLGPSELGMQLLEEGPEPCSF